MLQEVVFEDNNKNGIFDGDENVVEGAIVYLDYLVEDSGEQSISVDKNMVYENGTYQSFKNMKSTTDEQGIFTFKNLPIVDENNNVYQYRLRMYKPDGTEFTTVYPFKGQAQGKKNIYGGRVTKAEDVRENEGITKDILLAQKKGEDNYYHLEWEVEGQEYTRIYLGYYREKNLDIEIEDVLNESYPKYPSQPKTSDSSQPEILCAMMLVSGLYMTYQVLVYRRRRREAE